MIRQTGVVAAILIFAIASTGAAAAQQTPAPAPAAAQPNPEPSAENVALVKRFFEVVKLDETMRALMKNLVPALENEETSEFQDLTADQMTAILDATEEATADWFPHYFDRVAIEYARVFTKEELTAMIGFYDSPIGRSVVAKQATLAPVVTRVMEASLPEFKAMLVDRLCRKLDCQNLKRKDPVPS